MCGRMVLEASREAIGRLFRIKLDGPYAPRFNIAPSEPVLHVHTLFGAPQFDFARWGLIPHWHKDPSVAQMLINARIETVLDKPSFRAGIRHRRVLVPATHFYEWRREGKLKQPYAVNRKQPDGEEGLFAFAGIVDEWAGKDGGELTTLALLTQQADGEVAKIHHRMPVVVPPDHYASWLDCMGISSDTAVAQLREPIPDAWQLWPVDGAVNRGGVDGPGLLEPVEIAAPMPPKPDPQLDLF